MEHFFQDVRCGVRGLLRHPLFALVAVCTLAVGIGANTAIFSVVNAVLLRPLPYRDATQLVLVWASFGDSPQTWLSTPEVEDVRRSGTAFQDVAALTNLVTVSSVSNGNDSEEVRIVAATPNTFDLLGVQPQLGRNFTAEEDNPGAPRVLILSYGYWASHFAGNPDIVGHTVSLDGESYTVVGVMPREFRIPPPSSVFPDDVQMWLPFIPSQPEYLTQSRAARHVHVIARLKPNMDLAAAGTDLHRLGAQLASDFPADYPAARRFDLSAVSFQEHIVHNVRRALLALSGAVGFVLLIACANVANLLLTRAAGRQREIRVRSALGASRWRLMRQLLTENALLALCGGAGGWALAIWGMDLAGKLGLHNVPRFDEVTFDARVLIFTVGLSAATALLFGAIPAFQTAGTIGPRTIGDRGSMRDVLAVCEISLALALLIATGLMTRSFLRLQNTETGFDPRSVLTFRLTMPPARFENGTRVEAFLETLLANLRRLPEVRSVGAISHLPMSGSVLGSRFQIPETSPDPSFLFAADLRAILPDYFESMRIPLRAGRVFNTRDDALGKSVAIIDEVMAQRLWPGEDPVGKQLRWIRQDTPLEIVGVVGSVKHAGPGVQASETVYRPIAQYMQRTMYVTIQTKGNTGSVLRSLREFMANLDAAQPIADVHTMEERLDQSVGQPRFSTALLGIFATTAILLAALGIYGAVAYNVSQRTREIGVRIALGAQPGHVVRVIVGQTMTVGLAGLVLGIALAMLGARFLATLLYEISPTDFLTYTSLSLFVWLVILSASYLPARRATRISPNECLRSD